MAGRPVDDLCERFRAASDTAYYIAESPERVLGKRLVWRGEVGRARVILTRLLALADERGEPMSYACSGCTCASSSCAPATGRPRRGCSTNGPSPPTGSC